MKPTKNQLVESINDYLGKGGLFNPELMDHQKVSQLLQECRDRLLNDNPDGEFEVNDTVYLNGGHPYAPYKIKKIENGCVWIESVFPITSISKT